ncbi:hypothetical protein BSK59_01955 [Paenibacillus odorifer]|uniref:helix-turn-helix transcriptional regulator n=1 Tax=Paenibacillus odorifer TaxID=189426 RepID=UPI00096FF541|nr:helix-turn-helix transcriptional regulator [Paenibacillus odorifer]OME62256.1 hypothetical protein BSK59_01955 [Paenibacillus odorifer]
MPDGSYPFPMYSGLLEPEHYKKIGSAIWLFLWCVSSTTSEKERDGTVWGIVHGNKPWKLSELAEPFGATEKTVSRWLNTLESHGYIKVTRAPYGLIINVHNSKKWVIERTDKNVRSEGEKGQKCPISTPSDQTKMSDLQDKNVRSNKDITKILIDRWINGLEEDDQKELSSRSGVLTAAVGAVSTGQIDLDKPTVEQRVLQIEQYYMQRNGLISPVPSDWEHVREIANEAMPLDLVYFFIDLAIARKKAKRRRPSDKIRTFSYCKTVIFGCWDELSSFLERYLTPPVSSQQGTVALGASRERPKSKQQQEIDDLEEFIKEEELREQAGNR